ncbi:MAG: hypothetical protein A2785_01040 [Candidatus Chisholmbacteria bacterium RIFCSPHIGHO2_01_FULL_49_18]|uniref:Uncharacterized protein n=1 Tax=Candidatus Chisholmbacteria bacterium RIFCSPHIGHO2_01_FULL_49_18 TaxID=1797590 RepID=A0A1G1VLP6_9BACT|nr:MAG: hypothetical protein A2785_01040 [Candidatus Chisholmbacteria bacterium RIFCSPHIGHO2_01_FULL_49_18]
MPKSREKITSKSRKTRSRKKLVIFGGFGFFIIIYIVLQFYTPRSTLQWEEKQGKNPPLRELCQEPEQIFPPTSRQWPFPAFSPDGKYYIDVADFKLGKKKILGVFKTDTQKEVGRYYSAYSSLFIFCWAKDSSGIYVADRDPGGTGFGIFSPPGKIGPTRKVIVP